MALLWRRLWIQVTADRKRFAVLCVTMAIGLLLWSRIILVSKVPRTAMADEAPATGKPVPADSDAVSRPKAAAKPAAGKTGDRGAAASSTGGSDEPPKPMLIVAVQLQQTPDRDPFHISEAYFPKPNSLSRIAQDASKSPAQTSEDSEAAKDALRIQLQGQVDRFKLEAVMQGTPMAVINGRTYRQGDLVPAVDFKGIEFRLTEVGRGMVVLECQGHRFEKHMATPGS